MGCVVHGAGWGGNGLRMGCVGLRWSGLGRFVVCGVCWVLVGIGCVLGGV